MPILTTSTRKVVIDHVEDDETVFSVTFDFPFVEDLNLEKVRKKIQNGEGESSDGVAGLTLYTIIRSAIVDQEGILDESKPIASEGGVQYEKIQVKNPDGTINDTNQKIVMEVVKTYNEGKVYWDAVSAYLNTTGKNLKTGATQR